ncbi:MAG: hypothetical protein KatS3mg029_0668 [Saprospiraceae bacterium]|nr:MAG: hypothetical protein KatS3mg029_0668 [Saprospiraceae bacterium]
MVGKVVNVRLFDSNGRQCMASKGVLAAGRGLRMDVSGLPPGLYWLRAEAGTQVGWAKLVVW